MELFDSINARYEANANRVGTLILLAARTGGKREGAMLEGSAADLLRAAIVFLHATMEDVLRTLGRQRLKRGDAEALAMVQIALGGKNKQKQWALRELAGQRERSVGELIDGAIDDYLSIKSFSSSSAMSEYIEMLGLKAIEFQNVLPELDALAKRRHQIVHTADLDRHDSHEPRELKAADASDLDVWVLAVNTFVLKLLTKLNAPERVTLELVAKAEASAKELVARKAVRQTMRDEAKGAI